MAGFFIWESKPLIIQLEPEGVLDDAKNVIVSFHQMYGANIEKSGAEIMLDLEKTRIECYLSQEETSSFEVGSAEIQVNILYEDSERDASCKGTLEVWDNLHKEVMT